MAEVVGSVSAITSLVTLALQSSITLYQTVQSLQSRDKVIRELRQEVEALQTVLQALDESICSFDVDLTALTQPLMRCNNACNEFNALIMKCTPRSSGERSSKRDWLRMRYMGEDITGFKDMLASYKSTISLALAYANLRTTKTTRGVLEEYKELIENTKCDLENHLYDIRERLQTASSQGPVVSGIDTVELQLMEEEKDSTQKSLEICEQFFSLINQSRPSLLGEVAHSLSPFDHMSGFFNPNVSSLINAEGLNSTYKEITSWKLRLLQHLHGVDRIVQGQQRNMPRLNTEPEPEEQNFREDLSGTESLLNFCKQVEEEAKHQRTHYFEDVSTGDNSRQAIVTTLEDLISAKRIKSGNNSYQALGRMADESIQSFFNSAMPNDGSNDHVEKEGK
ncbi:hypothetical protein N7520_003559 [Penicillium odoratum]|uniref:uncharacterized protein n=1 Tax=Penicillium odoratum TaxID=1167516 RepID=UPI0025477FF0|nr:uncharacterized protein N7520_003559 [Penicillium odoratum]KAJ5769000.1 hypothetical protein N7520_003559 [Penicillium odoratum]